MIERIDQNLGRLLTPLDQLGLADNDAGPVHQ
jgi:arylsulfatase A-like enzyme